MRPSGGQETGVQDLFRSQLDQIYRPESSAAGAGAHSALAVAGAGVWGGLHG